MKHLTKKRLSRWLTLAAVTTLTVGVSGTVQTVKAADDSWPVVKSQVVDPGKTAVPIPEPLDPDTGLRAYVPFNNAMTTLKESSPEKIDGTSSGVWTNAAGNNVAVQLTDNFTQSGSIWSTSKLKLQQNFSTKMHIYFGNNAKPADGMAFVLKGGARPTSVLNVGSGIGVWGVGTNLNMNGRMPDSFAVTFDTYFNGDTTDGNVDKISAGYASTDEAQYVGWGFPGVGNDDNYKIMQYQRAAKGQLLFDSTNAADGGINKANGKLTGKALGLGGYHVLPITKTGPEKFTDGQWHTVTVNWETNNAKDGGGKLTFTVELSPNDTFSKTMTWTAADITKIFGATALSQGVNWGFTGSTGKMAEDGVVVFESIPGLVDGGVSTTVKATDGSDAPKTVNVGDTLNQVYNITYNSSNSKQSWPINTAGLTATLRTTDGYGFQLDANNQVAVTVKLNDGTTKTVMGTLGKDPISVTDKYGNTKKYAEQINVTLPGFTKGSDNGQIDILTVPIVAAKEYAEATASAGTVAGNNAQYTATVKTPAVVPNLWHIDAPNFVFNNLTVGQIIKGFTGYRATGDAGVINTEAPAGVQTTITAKMSPVDFPANTGYTPGNTAIGFIYSGKAVTLPDNATEQTVYSGSTPPASGALSNVTLAMKSYPQIKVGSYSADILWTIAATPVP